MIFGWFGKIWSNTIMVFIIDPILDAAPGDRAAAILMGLVKVAVAVGILWFVGRLIGCQLIA